MAIVDQHKVNKTIVRSVILYFIIFILYLLFTRKPGYFTAEKTKGVVVGMYQQQEESGNTLYIKEIPIIHFKTATDSVEFIYRDDEYLSKFEQGDLVNVIYEGSDAGSAAVLSPIGYWVTLNELMAFLILCAAIIGIIKALYAPKVKMDRI